MLGGGEKLDQAPLNSWFCNETIRKYVLVTCEVTKEMCNLHALHFQFFYLSIEKLINKILKNFLQWHVKH